MAAVPKESGVDPAQHGGLAEALLVPPMWAPLSGLLAQATQVTWPETLSADELRALLVEAGSPPEWVEPLVAIAFCESHGRPAAVGDAGASLGVWQLWVGWARDGEDLMDPLTSARVALRIREIRGRFGGGGGWSCAGLLGIE